MGPSYTDTLYFKVSLYFKLFKNTLQGDFSALSWNMTCFLRIFLCYKVNWRNFAIKDETD